jgi:hypothetical protein
VPLHDSHAPKKEKGKNKNTEPITGHTPPKTTEPRVTAFHVCMFRTNDGGIFDQDAVAESIEDGTASNDVDQEEELEALAEALEKEISESPPDPEESEVMAGMAEAAHAGASRYRFP